MVRKRRAMRPEDKPQISGSKERAMQHRSIKTWGITAFLLVAFSLLAAGTYLVTDQPAPDPTPSWLTTKEDGKQFERPKVLDYELLQTFDHDPHAFSQGIVYEEICPLGATRPCSQVFWESTGLYGKSTVRCVDVESGDVLKSTSLPDVDFGEGLVKLKDKLYQLTWQKPDGFIYDTKLKKVGEFKTSLSDGWGFTTDGISLIVTDSSHKVYWIDPSSFEITRQINVKDGKHPVKWLNELEWIENEIWANVWQTDCIARIDPKSGRVNSWMHMGTLTKLAKERARAGHTRMDVLNGIAWDEKNRNVYITGKLWPTVYQIRAIESDRLPSDAELASIRKSCIPGLQPRLSE